LGERREREQALKITFSTACYRSLRGFGVKTLAISGKPRLSMRVG
jgi:hypothetical protein